MTKGIGYKGSKANAALGTTNKGGSVKGPDGSMANRALSKNNVKTISGSSRSSGKMVQKGKTQGFPVGKKGK